MCFIQESGIHEWLHACRAISLACTLHWCPLPHNVVCSNLYTDSTLTKHSIVTRLCNTGLTWCHMISHDTTWCHMISWSHMISHDTTWCHMISHDVTCLIQVCCPRISMSHDVNIGMMYQNIKGFPVLHHCLLRLVLGQQYLTYLIISTRHKLPVLVQELLTTVKTVT